MVTVSQGQGKPIGAESAGGWPGVTEMTLAKLPQVGRWWRHSLGPRCGVHQGIRETRPMITLYTFATPNGRKASILLEELGLAYTVHKLDVMAGEHRTADYLKFSPIGKLPALVETTADGKTCRLFGSGAILLHYAEQTGQLLPIDVDARAECLSWFFMGISDLGPAAVEMFRFSVRLPEKLPSAIDLFKGELIRCYNALDQRLSVVEYLAGEYSIADIACYPFIAAAALSSGSLLDRFPNLKRWHDLLGTRPAVVRGMLVPEL